MQKRILSMLCALTLVFNIFPCVIGAAETNYSLNESFNATFTQISGKSNLIVGGSIGSEQNYRDKSNSLSENTIETDNIKTNYFKQSLIGSSSSNWRGVWLDVTNPSTSEYQLLEFDFKMNDESDGLWVQVCDDSETAAGKGGSNVASRAVIFNIKKSSLDLNHKNSTYKTLNLYDYGLPRDLSANESWHNVKVVIDTIRCTYDLIINDILVATDVSAGQEQTTVPHAVKHIYFSAQGNASGNYVGIDDVRVSDLTATSANDLVKAGFDAFFANNAIVSNTLQLPFGGTCGANTTDGTGKITYSSDNSTNVSITNTKYSSSAGETKLSFTDVPSEGENDVDFNLSIGLSRPVKDASPAVKNFSYPLKLSYQDSSLKNSLKDRQSLHYSDLIQYEYSNKTSDAAKVLVAKLNLPQTGESGQTISWSSSHPELIDIAGNVTKGAEEQVVTLTADFGNDITKSFKFLVQASEIQKIYQDKATIELPATATESFLLPYAGERYGSSITWETGSADNFAIIIQGRKALVTRPAFGEADAVVTLIPTLTLGGESVTFDGNDAYTITVPALETEGEVDEDVEYRIFQSFDGRYTPDSVNPNIITGPSISAHYNYRGGKANTSKNTIESDAVKQNFFKQSLLSNSEASSNWRGVYFDLDSTPRSEYQLLEFDFKISEESDGLWVQVCDDFALDSGNNTGKKFVIFNIGKNKIELRNSSTSFKNIEYAQYGLPSDISKTGGWHNIKVIMDTKRYLYDILLDDYLIAADVISAAAPDTLIEADFVVKRLYFSAQGIDDGSYIGLDDIKLSDLSAEKANDIIKKGFDTLFASDEIYGSSFPLPFAGMQGYYPDYNGQAKIAYATTNGENVVIKDTHYTTSACDTKLEFVNAPASESDADIPFKLFVRLERPVYGAEPAVSAFGYDLKLSYLSASKKASLDATLLTYNYLTGEDRNSLRTDLTLPTVGANGSAVSWTNETGNDEVIDPTTGKVTRQNEDTAVTLKATFDAGGELSYAYYNFVVKKSVRAQIMADEAAFVKPDFANITADFEIPLTGSVNGSKITWTTSNAAIFIKDNKALVTRPSNEAGDVAVVLTAKYELDFETVSFTYNLTVKKQLSDAQAVDLAYENLTESSITIENINEISQKLSLMTELENGVRCSWHSSNEALITYDGTVTCPVNVPNPEDRQVTLTATLSKGEEYSRQRVFVVTVVSFENDSMVAERAKNLLTFNLLSDEDISAVTNNLTLPSKGYNNTDITWSSNNPNALFVSGNTGMVIRPEFGSNDASVTLKATITYNEESVEKSFIINVLEKTGYEIVFSSNGDMEGSSIGGAPVVDGIGKVRFENPDRGVFEMVQDPVNPQKKVAMLTRNADQSLSCMTTYLTNFGSQHFSTDELTVNTKMYIPSDVEHSIWYYVSAYETLSGGMVPIVLIDFAPDGKVKFNYILGGTKLELIPGDFTYTHDEWFTLKIKGNTYTRLYDVYINDRKISENVFIDGNALNPFDTSRGLPFYDSDENSASNFYGIRIRHEGDASATPKSIYLDDISVERKIQYGPETDNAMAEFRLKFLAENPVESIYQNLKFPVLETEGVSVEYISENENIVTNNGTVHFTDSEQRVKLLVKFTGSGGKVAYANYDLTIVSKNDPVFGAQMTDAERVEADVESVVAALQSSYNLANITSNMTFAQTAVNGSSISYVSSDETVLTNGGAITRATTDKTVTLTITATFNSTTSTTRTLSVTVKKLTQTTQSSGGGGGGGGGSYSGTTEPEQTVEEEDGKEDEKPNDNEDETPTPDITPVFTDVKEDFWAYKEIVALEEAGIVSGTGDGSFNPSATVKREELVRMLVSSLALDDTQADKEFSDADSNAWYYPFIQKAVSAGLVNGYDDGSFGIGHAITRQDLAVMIYNSVKSREDFTEAQTELFEDDSEISDYAKAAIYALKANELVYGKEANMFAPKAYVTRAEAAVMIYRIMK